MGDLVGFERALDGAVKRTATWIRVERKLGLEIATVGTNMCSIASVERIQAQRYPKVTEDDGPKLPLPRKASVVDLFESFGNCLERTANARQDSVDIISESVYTPLRYQLGKVKMAKDVLNNRKRLLEKQHRADKQRASAKMKYAAARASEPSDAEQSEA